MCDTLQDDSLTTLQKDGFSRLKELDKAIEEEQRAIEGLQAEEILCLQPVV